MIKLCSIFILKETNYSKLLYKIIHKFHTETRNYQKIKNKKNKYNTEQNFDLQTATWIQSVAELRTIRLSYMTFPWDMVLLPIVIAQK